MNVKAVIFDMDGTLVDSLFFWDYLWGEIGKRYMGDESFKPSFKVDKNVRTMIYSEAMNYVKEYYQIDTRGEDFVAFCIDEIERFYAMRAKIKVGATALLDHLVSKGVSLVLASGSEMKHILIALDATGLCGYFNTILSCNDIGSGKDKPDIYIEALRHLNMDASDVAVVEDSYVALESAASLGVHTVGVYDEHNFGHDRLAAVSEVYIGEGDNLASLISVF